MKRRLLILIAGATLLGLAAFVAVSVYTAQRSAQHRPASLSGRLIAYVDQNGQTDEPCPFSMNDLVDFQWDKLAMYQPGTPAAEISQALGVDFKDATDQAGGLVFVSQDKIVYQESIPSKVNEPSRLVLVTGTEKAIATPPISVVYSTNPFFEGTRTSGPMPQYRIRVRAQCQVF